MTFIAVAASDIHYPFHDQKVHTAFESLVDDLRPDFLVLDGDIIDGEALSRHPDAEGSDAKLEDEVQCAVENMNRLIAKAKRTVILEGNHDERLSRFLGLHRRAVKNVETFRLRHVMKHYGLTQKGVEWLSAAEYKQGYVIGQAHPVLFRHGHKGLSSGATGAGGITRANKLLQRYPDMSQVVGHHHLAALRFHNSFARTNFAMVLPCLQGEPNYDPETNWQRGCGIITWYGGKTLDSSPHVQPGLVIAAKDGSLAWGKSVWTGRSS